MDERREFERVSTALPVSITMPGAGDHRHGVTLNVSASGAAIDVEGEMLVAGNVQLSFGGPHLEGITCTARIVWVGSSAYGMAERARLGLHYIDLNDSDRARLQSVLYGRAGVRSRAQAERTGSGAFVAP